MSWTVGSPIVAACWSIVIVVWVVGAVQSVRTAPKVERRDRCGVVPLTFVAIAILALTPIDWGSLHFGSPWPQVVGAALLLLSTAFTIWARRSLGTMWSITAAVREHHELRTAGPYSVTRHPIYTGLIGMMLGTALLIGSGEWILISIAGVVVLVGKAAREERVMASVFGERYRTYRARTPMIVPRPWRGRRAEMA
jgi:protein-S-isoprenylcysteine O-methyltransferase Ste14